MSNRAQRTLPDIHSLQSSVLLHPLALWALALLLFNDHVLKSLCPSALTGKLSDFSGLLFFPLWLHAVAWRVLGGQHHMPRVQAIAATKKPPVATGANLRSNRLLLAALLSTAAGFSAIQLSASANGLYEVLLGGLQWPFRALFGLLCGQGLTPFARVASTPDPSDLLALPSLVGAYYLGRRPVPSTRQVQHQYGAGVAALTGVALAMIVGVAPAHATDGYSPGLMPQQRQRAEEKERRRERKMAKREEKRRLKRERRRASAYRHDGLMLRGEGGLGCTWARSSRSFSNGFQQNIASRVSGVVMPYLGAQAGWSPRPGLILGLRGSYSTAPGLELTTLGQTVFIPDLQLALAEGGAFLAWYPDAYGGQALEAALSGAGLELQERQPGQLEGRKLSYQDTVGFGVRLSYGWDLWLLEEWSLGVRASVQAFYVEHTSLVQPLFSIGLNYN